MRAFMKLWRYRYYSFRVSPSARSDERARTIAVKKSGRVSLPNKQRKTRKSSERNVGKACWKQSPMDAKPYGSTAL